MKCNEAGAFRKTYDHIIGRLKDEKRHFDVQLAQAMETLRAKEADLAELIQMSNDAHRAKEAAKAELAKLELTIAEERKIRQKELAERRKLVQARGRPPRHFRHASRPLAAPIPPRPAAAAISSRPIRSCPPCHHHHHHYHHHHHRGGWGFPSPDGRPPHPPLTRPPPPARPACVRGALA